MSRITDLSAVVVLRPALQRIRLPEMPCPVPLGAAQGMAFPQVPEPFRPRPEEVMPR